MPDWDGGERRSGVTRRVRPPVPLKWPGRRRTDYPDEQAWERWVHWRDMPRLERIEYICQFEARYKRTSPRDRILDEDRYAAAIETRARLEAEQAAVSRL